MTRYLLDTNVLSEVARRPGGTASAHIRRVGEAAICTSIIVAGELRYGAAKSASPRIIERVEAILDLIEVLPLEPAVDAAYGTLRADLERAGNVIGANDLWIAAHALALNCTIVTGNEREFRRVEGLPLENWLLEA
ncbi:MAG: type II toxin-antitoxin system VapC family toxin [Chloroflexi bacterium]|nr:type II toxin-antitoxin system VapC family toxin [Chloroflexota bacterium]